MPAVKCCRHFLYMDYIFIFLAPLHIFMQLFLCRIPIAIGIQLSCMQRIKAGVEILFCKRKLYKKSSTVFFFSYKRDMTIGIFNNAFANGQAQTRA